MQENFRSRAMSAVAVANARKSSRAASSIPTIELSIHQAINLVDAVASFEVIGPEDETEEPPILTKDDAVLEAAEVEAVLDNSDSLSTLIWATPTSPGERKRAALLSATFTKEGPNHKLGVGLAKTSNGKLVIASMQPEGLLSQSPFRVGDQLVSINSVSCHNMRKSEAARFLQSVTGSLTIVAQNDRGDSQLVESMIWKPKPNSKTGLAVVSTGYSRARVSNIRPDGLFEKSLLSRKDLILSVNNIPCQGLDSKEVADIVCGAKDYVSVVAERKYENAVVVAMAQ